MTAFVDFGKKTEYSPRLAMGNTKNILPILKEREQKYFAVSDYSEISGWVQQLFTCKENNIIPILGIETFINNYRIHKEGIDIEIEKIGEWRKSVKDVDEVDKDLSTIDYSIDLFAVDIDGYYNIIQIHNDAQINGVAKRPRTNDAFIKDHGKGVIAIFTTPFSEVSSLIYNGETEKAISKYDFYKNVFDDVYLAIPILEESDYKEINEKMIQFSKANGIKMIPVINSHFNKKEDEESFEVFKKIAKIRGGHTFEVDYTPGMYYKTKEEVFETFNVFHKSPIFTETVMEELFIELDNLCNKFKLIDIDTTPKMPHVDNAKEILRKKAYEGLERKGLVGKKEYEERLEYELDNVIRAGFADYFLFLEDLYSWWIDEMGKTPSTGRGSGAGSLLLYCLRVMNVDPLKYNLLFERFLDASRLDEIINKGGKVTADNFPDVDCDFDGEGKEMVREYFVKRYGYNSVCTIGTFGVFKVKGVLKELARIYDISPEEVNEVTTGEMKVLDDEDEGMPIEELRKKYVSLNNFIEKYPQIENGFNNIYGTISNWSSHAGGMLIVDFDLTKVIPVRVTDGNLITCWTEGLTGRELSQMGYVKMDILAINTVSTIDKIINMINERHGTNLDFYDIPINDFDSLDLLNKHDVLGTFQFDTNLASRVIDNMGGITCFEDLPALSTLMRPAALQNGFDKKFGELRNNKEEVFIPESLKPYLGKTNGLPIYQEAAYHIAYHLAGFDKVTSYRFMKLLYKGKMTEDKIPYWRDKFLEGCRDKIKHVEYELEFDNGKVLKYRSDDMLDCTDGKSHTIEEIINEGYEIKDD